MLVGPTASGKSAAALALARQFGGEIVSIDSALVYRDMNIGTAKPTAAERAEVPHHLIDLIAPTGLIPWRGLRPIAGPPSTAFMLVAICLCWWAAP